MNVFPDDARGRLKEGDGLTGLDLDEFLGSESGIEGGISQLAH